jgi:hypothetical protein
MRDGSEMPLFPATAVPWLAPAAAANPTLYHVIHREDKWFYVATAQFIFEIDGKRSEFSKGGSLFAPRSLPHR